MGTTEPDASGREEMMESPFVFRTRFVASSGSKGSSMWSPHLFFTIKLASFALALKNIEKVASDLNFETRRGDHLVRNPLIENPLKTEVGF
jgi:hypothetical protein